MAMLNILCYLTWNKFWLLEPHLYNTCPRQFYGNSSMLYFTSVFCNFCCCRPLVLQKLMTLRSRRTSYLLLLEPRGYMQPCFSGLGLLCFLVLSLTKFFFSWGDYSQFNAFIARLLDTFLKYRLLVLQREVIRYSCCQCCDIFIGFSLLLTLATDVQIGH